MSSEKPEDPEENELVTAAKQIILGALREGSFARSAPMLAEIDSVDAIFEETLGKLRDILNAHSKSDLPKPFVHYIVECMLSRKNPLNYMFLLKILDKFSQSCPGSVRLIFEEILTNKSFKQFFFCTYEPFRIQALVDFIKRYLPYLDYKNFRDVYKLLIVKVCDVPTTYYTSQIDLVDSYHDLIKSILDNGTENCPRFLLLHEIMQIINTGSFETSFHWRFSKLFYDYINQFYPCAQILTISGKEYFYPIYCHSHPFSIVWRLHTQKLKFNISSTLPFHARFSKKQTQLFEYVLSQPGCREFALAILGIAKSNKSQIPAIEDHMTKLIYRAVAETDSLGSPENELDLWSILSGNVVSFLMHGSINLVGMLSTLYNMFPLPESQNGRHWFMWLILQACSIFITKGCKASELDSVFDIIRYLYPDPEPLPVPLLSDVRSIAILSAVALWYLLTNKLMTQKDRADYPPALRLHYDFIAELNNEPRENFNDTPDRKLPLIFYIHEAVQTNQYFEAFIKRFCSCNVIAVSVPYVSYSVYGPASAFSMDIVNAFSTSAKLVIARTFSREVAKKMIATKNSCLISPGGLEIFARFCSSPEAEVICGAEISNNIYQAFKEDCLQIISLYADLNCCRMKRSYGSNHTKLQIFHFLNLAFFNSQSIAAHPQLQTTLIYSVNNLLSVYNNFEFLNHISKLTEEQRIGYIHKEYPEINFMLALKLTKILVVSGIGVQSEFSCGFDFLGQIQSIVPHSWPEHFLEHCPLFIQDLYRNHECVGPSENTKISVDDDYKKMMQVLSSNALHVTEVSKCIASPQNHNFLAIIYKYILEEKSLSAISVFCMDVIEGIKTRNTLYMLNVLVEYVFIELSTTSFTGLAFNKCIDTLIFMCTKLNLFAFDRLIFTLLFKLTSEQGIRISSLLIFCLLMKYKDLDEGIKFFKKVTPKFALNQNWHETYIEYHKTFPERMFWEGLKEAVGLKPNGNEYLPLFYGNLCFRMIPLFDLIIQRFIEVPSFSKQLERVLEFASIYRFHGCPLYFVYSTLHFYHRRFVHQPLDQWRLVKSILQPVIKEFNYGWSFCPSFVQEIESPSPIEGLPNFESSSNTILMHFYTTLVNVMYCENDHFPKLQSFDRLHGEFQNAPLQVLICGAIEILTCFAQQPTSFWNLISNFFLHSQEQIAQDKKFKFLNATGLLMSALPTSFWTPVLSSLYQTFTSSPLLLKQSPSQDFIDMLDFQRSMDTMTENPTCSLIVLIHALLEHANDVQIMLLANLLKDNLAGVCFNESKFFYLCQIFFPYLHKFQSCGSSILLEVASSFYDALHSADMNVEEFVFADTISNLLYYMKYRFTGDFIRSKFEQVIPNLKSQKLKQLLNMMCRKA